MPIYSRIQWRFSKRQRRSLIPAQGNALGQHSSKKSGNAKGVGEYESACSQLWSADIFGSKLSQGDQLTMAQSLARLWTHLIFSTKERFPFLSDKAVRTDMHAYLATVLRNHDCETLIVGGVADHIHALFSLSRNYSIATIVKEIKRTSSSWVKDVSPQLRKFHWQNGYGAFSVSQSDLGRVIAYIERQEEHHRRVTFKDEFRAFLKRYEIEYDERYVWD